MSNQSEESWEPSLSRPFYLKYIDAVHEKWTDYILPNVGISLLILAQFFNSIMIVTCKLLVTDKDFNVPIHPLQILFVRMFITYSCCLAYMLITKSVPDAPWGPRDLRPMLALRGFAGFFGVFGLYFSLQYLSLSDAVAITFLVPMVTAFLAWILLHERYSFLEAICLVVSLGGVLLIAKPNFIFGSESDKETNGVNEDIESLSTLARLVATTVGLIGVCGALSVYIVLRKIGHRAHALLSVSYFALWCVILTFASIIVIPGLLFALPQNRYQWFLFALIGFSGFFMQFSLTAGIQRVKAGKAALMSYINMVFAIIWDLIIWQHVPGLLSMLGIVLIVGNAAIVLKYKPTEKTPDLESAPAEYASVPLDEQKDNTNSPDLIALEDFTITDDEEEREGVKNS